MGDPAAPRVLRNRYRLGDVLGVGTHATVYRAEDLLLRRGVAVKVVTGGAADAAILAAQEAEARRLAGLTMHGLVTLFDVAVERSAEGPATVFLVLELVDGTDLKRVLARGPLPARQVAHIGLDLAEALHHMHERGVVHRDVTPANVLLLDHAAERRPRVKLGDFGLQDLVGGAAASGAYRSPEQIAGEPANGASDVYALGLVLVECLTGRPDGLDDVVAGEWRRPLTAMLDPDPAARPDAATLVATFGRLVVEETGRHREAPRRSEETARLAAVRAYGVLDTPPDAPFDRIADLASRVLGTRMAAIGLLDADRIWFKARVGELPAEVPRVDPLHVALLEGASAAAVRDAAADPELSGDPLVALLGIRFAAAAPIRTAEGLLIGLLAVYDETPADLDPSAADTLTDLAAIVLHELELRRAARRAALARR